jgi:hypothetical protein
MDQTCYYLSQMVLTGHRGARGFHIYERMTCYTFKIQYIILTHHKPNSYIHEKLECIRTITLAFRLITCSTPFVIQPLPKLVGTHEVHRGLQANDV